DSNELEFVLIIIVVLVLDFDFLGIDRSVTSRPALNLDTSANGYYASVPFDLSTSSDVDRTTINRPIADESRRGRKTGNGTDELDLVFVVICVNKQRQWKSGKHGHNPNPKHSGNPARHRSTSLRFLNRVTQSE